MREYEDTDQDRLPDERYSLQLVYYDQPQLIVLRDAYITQLSELERTIHEVWDVTEEIYQENRIQTGRDDWESCSSKVLGGKVQEKCKTWFAGHYDPEKPVVEAKVAEPTEGAGGAAGVIPWEVCTCLDCVALVGAAVAIFFFFLRDVGEFLNSGGPDKK